MSFKEEPVLWVIGKVLIAVGIGGLVFTLFFDQIAGRKYPIYDWVQIGGMIAFVLLAIFGLFVDKFMTHDIIPMIKKYLEN